MCTVGQRVSLTISAGPGAVFPLSLPRVSTAISINSQSLSLLVSHSPYSCSHPHLHSTILIPVHVLIRVLLLPLHPRVSTATSSNLQILSSLISFCPYSLPFQQFSPCPCPHLCPPIPGCRPQHPAIVSYLHIPVHVLTYVLLS